MESFILWLESSLRDNLQAPQNTKHHPEGNVAKHTYMVKHAMQSAINLLKDQQEEDPNGPLKQLNLILTKEDTKLLKLSALLHDIGKSIVTNPINLSSHGHEDPENFELAMSYLGPVWQKMYQNANENDKTDLWFLIKNHMKIGDKDMIEDKSLKRLLMTTDGNYKNERKYKLLLIIFLMDRMGRGSLPNLNAKQSREFSKNNIEPAKKRINNMYQSSQWILQNQPHIKQDIINSPEEFVNKLKIKNIPNIIIIKNIKNKFPNLSDEEIHKLLIKESIVSFKVFLENQDPYEMEIQIPLPEEIFHLSKIFKKYKKKLYVVGGAVRDFLFNKSKPKDVDLCTDASPQEVGNILTKENIRNFPKGEAFGVWVAHINNEDYEIATFREDIGTKDGRRPEEVKFTDLASDYKRRDLTMNALYYEIPNSSDKPGKIIDYGNGIQDIQNKKVKTVGDPYDRFGEDRLRILRVPRFHTRYNDTDIDDAIDQRTKDAIKHYANLRNTYKKYNPDTGEEDNILDPISSERIQKEFETGLLSSKNTTTFLKTYEKLGLLPAVFPNLNIDTSIIDKLNIKNPIVTLTALLRNNGKPEQIRNKLNKLKWNNEIVDEITFLLNVWQSQPEQLYLLTNQLNKKLNRRKNIKELNKILSNSHIYNHLAEFEPNNYKGEDIMKDLKLDKPGPDIGIEQKRRNKEDYDNSLKNYKL